MCGAEEADANGRIPPADELLCVQTVRVDNPRTARLADLACLAVVGTWGINFAIMKRSLERFDIPVFNLVRFSLMMVLGTALLGWNHRSRGHALLPQPEDRARIALAGGVGFFGYLYGFTIGLHRTTAFSASLLMAMSPLFVAVLLWVTKSESLHGRHMVALVLAVMGAVIFVFGRNDGAVAFRSGDVFALGAAFLYAAYLVINRPLTTKYPATSLTMWSMSVAYVVVLVVTLPFVGRQDWSRIDAGAWVSMAWAATAPVFIAWTVWAWANSKVGVARPSLFMVLVPVISGMVAWWYLHEQVRVLQVVGVVLVLSGLLVARRRSTVSGSTQKASVRVRRA